MRSTGIFTKKLDAGLVVPTNGREFLIGSPRRLLQSQRQIIALGAAPGSSYGRCPDAGSLKFPQTPFIVRFPSAWCGPSERRLFCQKGAGSAALAHASEITGLPFRLRNYAPTIGWHYGRSVVVCNADNETSEDEPDDSCKKMTLTPKSLEIRVR